MALSSVDRACATPVTATLILEVQALMASVGLALRETRLALGRSLETAAR
jgi:hypothetical protein